MNPPRLVRLLSVLPALDILSDVVFGAGIAVVSFIPESRETICEFIAATNSPLICR